MKNRNYISGINWRQIVIHFVACWFFIYAFQTLSYLYDTELVDIIRQASRTEAFDTLEGKGVTASDLVYFELWIQVSGFIGLLVALIVSLLISIKRQWFWGNSFIIFAIAYILRRFDLLGWDYLKKFFLYFGHKFNNTTTEFIFNGTVLLIIGSLIFFLKGINKFIESDKSERQKKQHKVVNSII